MKLGLSMTKLYLTRANDCESTHMTTKLRDALQNHTF